MFNTVSSSAFHVLPPSQGQTRPVGFGNNPGSAHSSSVRFGVGPSHRRGKPNNQVSAWRPLLTRQTLFKDIGTGALISGCGATGYMISRDNDQLDITGQNKRSTPQKALLATQYASLLVVCGGLWTAMRSSLKLCQSMTGSPDSDPKQVQQLVEAAGKNDLARVRSLAGSYVDINAPNHEDWTPLQAAASRGHSPVTAFLLSVGADVNQANQNGETPLWLAARNKEFLSVDRLVDAGADVNKSAHTSPGGAPLWVVAAYGDYNYDPKITHRLINKGADINKVNPVDGTTPMQAASRAGHTQIVELLRKKGARDVDAEIAARKAQEAQEAREAARRAQEAREARRMEKQPQQSFQMQAAPQQRELQQYEQQQGNQDEFKFVKKLLKKAALTAVSHMVGAEVDHFFS